MRRLTLRINTEWRTFLESLRFFTRLPLGYSPHDAGLLARSHPFFPAVGAVVGLILILTLSLVEPLLGRSLAVLVMLAVGWVLTGGFHEDGFADVCDGIWGGFTPQRRLEIMKDSRLGTFGSLGLIWLVAMKATALGQLEPGLLGPAIFIGHVIARASSVLMLAVFPTVHSDGGGPEFSVCRPTHVERWPGNHRGDVAAYSMAPVGIGCRGGCRCRIAPVRSLVPADAPWHQWRCAGGDESVG